MEFEYPLDELSLNLIYELAYFAKKKNKRLLIYSDTDEIKLNVVEIPQHVEKAVGEKIKITYQNGQIEIRPERLEISNEFVRAILKPKIIEVR